MKKVANNSAQVHENSPSCKVFEFGNISSIDAADIHINGRYPEQEFAINRKSDFVVRVLSGLGRVATKTSETELSSGDVVFVSRGEAYYFEGEELKMFMACTPAWNPEQYSEIET